MDGWGGKPAIGEVGLPAACRSNHILATIHGFLKNTGDLERET